MNKNATRPVIVEWHMAYERSTSALHQSLECGVGSLSPTWSGPPSMQFLPKVLHRYAFPIRHRAMLPSPCYPVHANANATLIVSTFCGKLHSSGRHPRMLYVTFSQVNDRSRPSIYSIVSEASCQNDWFWCVLL